MMIRILIKTLVYFFVFMIMTMISLVHIDSSASILFLSAVLAIANTFIRPILAVIALPFNIITFGITSIFANMLTLIIANAITGAIVSHGFWLMFLISAVIMVTDDLIRTSRIHMQKTIYLRGKTS